MSSQQIPSKIDEDIGFVLIQDKTKDAKPNASDLGIKQPEQPQGTKRPQNRSKLRTLWGKTKLQARAHKLPRPRPYQTQYRI